MTVRPPRFAGRDDATTAAAVEELVSEMIRAGVGPGELVALSGANGSDWVVAFAALTRSGAAVLPLPHDSPAAELDRLTAAARCQWRLTAAPGARPERVADGPAENEPGEVVLASSGSTGAPKLVRRSAASLTAEGRRYIEAGLCRPDDLVVLPLPLSHSYALGWLAGALACGARTAVLPPQRLAETVALLRGDATVLAVVPGLAKVLLRRLEKGPAPARLRLVMSGAGFVEQALDDHWLQTCGVGLSRNYGSSESGAVLSGPPGCGSGAVGRAMPNVTVTLLDPELGVEVDGEGTGEAVVRLEDGTVHRLGDLLRRDADGVHTVIGRRASGAVRRGHRWVSTLEVAATLARGFGIADVAVSAAPGIRDAARAADDDQDLVADFVPAGPEITPAVLTAYARENLAGYKVPNVVRAKHRIVRGPVGKVGAERTYRISDAAHADELLRARRRGEVLLALGELGVLPLLADGATPTEVAAALGLDAAVLAELLDAALRLGLLTTGDSTAPGPADVAAICAEAATGADHRALAAAIRGPGAPTARNGEDLDTVTAQLRAALPAMEGPELVVTPDAPGGELPRGEFARCFVIDAVHRRGAGSDLVGLARALRPGGRLVVADRFLDTPAQGDPFGEDVTLRWLAAGALYWWTLADLQGGCESVGLRLVDLVHGPARTQVVLAAPEPGTR
jgi:acyl-CoA synthetase (AMP-forming)/AMP-acid ligase II